MISARSWTGAFASIHFGRRTRRHRSRRYNDNHRRPCSRHTPCAATTRSNPMATATATATSKKMFIDGQWCAAQDGKTVGVINPATEEVIVEMAFGSRADVKRAIEAAGKAMPAWMKLTAFDRAKV